MGTMTIMESFVMVYQAALFELVETMLALVRCASQCSLRHHLMTAPFDLLKEPLLVSPSSLLSAGSLHPILKLTERDIEMPAFAECQRYLGRGEREKIQEDALVHHWNGLGCQCR